MNLSPPQIAALLGLPPLAADTRAFLGSDSLAAKQSHLELEGLAYEADAPSDGSGYMRQDGSWVAVAGGGDVEEAPIDGSLYGRRNAGWVIVPVALAASANLADLDDAGEALDNLESSGRVLGSVEHLLTGAESGSVTAIELKAPNGVSLGIDGAIPIASARTALGVALSIHHSTPGAGEWTATLRRIRAGADTAVATFLFDI